MRRRMGILIGVALLAGTLWFAFRGQATDTVRPSSFTPAPLSSAERAIPSGQPERPRGVSLEETLNFFLGSGVPVEGTVVDEAGRPVSGVSLFVLAPSEDEEGEPRALSSTASGEDGTFHLEAPSPGDYALKLSHPDYLETERRVTAPAKGARLVLPSGASVEAEVVDETGQPMAEAGVHVLPEPMPRFYRDRSGRTDAAGRATLQGLAPGRHIVVATTRVGGPVRAAKREVALRGSERVKVRLQFEEGQRLSGVVVDTAGKPVEGAELRVVPATMVDAVDKEYPELEPTAEQWEAGWFEGATPSQRSGPDGRFTLRHLSAVDYVMTALKDGYTFGSAATGGKRRTLGPYTGVLVPAGAGEVRLVLESLASVRGRVVRADGSPITRFQVNERYQEDAQGAFRWPIHATGEEVLAFVAPELAGTVRKVRVRKGEEVDLGDVVLEAGREVRVRVVAAETSTPLVGAHVDLREVGEEDPDANHSLLWSLTQTVQTPEGTTAYFSPEAFQTGQDGTVVLPQVEEGPRLLRVSHADYLGASASLEAEQREVTVALRSGAWLQGEVRAGKRHLRHGSVSLRTPQGQYVDFASIEDGHYSLGPLEAGSYILRAEPHLPYAQNPPVFLPTPVDVPAGGTMRLDLEAQRGGTSVEVRTLEPVKELLLVPGPQLLSCTREAFPAAFTLGHEGRADREGFFHFRPLPAGPYTLLAVRDWQEPELEVHREEVEVPDRESAFFTVQPRWQRCGSSPVE